MKNEVGLKQIALELNLSITAVSRALRDCSDISEKTKQKVRKKAIEIGYQPNFMASSLRTGKTNVIGIIVDSLCSPYFSFIIENIINYCKERNYTTLIIPTNKMEAYKDDIKECLKLRLDAILTFLIPTKEALEFANLNKIPILLFGRYLKEDGLNVVCTDDYTGGTLAAKYLYKTSHTGKFCYIGNKNIECSERRKNGFFDMLSKLGPAEKTYIEGENIENILPNLLTNDYDAFFCFDDILAVKVCLKGRVNNISVVGFNGSSRYSETAFDITSVESDYQEMVEFAIDTLIEGINGNKETKIKLFPTRIYFGES